MIQPNDSFAACPSIGWLFRRPVLNLEPIVIFRATTKLKAVEKWLGKAIPR